MLRVALSMCFIFFSSGRWVGACNSHSKPMSRNFYKLIFSLRKKGSSAPVTQWRQLDCCNSSWHSHGSLLPGILDLKKMERWKRLQRNMVELHAPTNRLLPFLVKEVNIWWPRFLLPSSTRWLSQQPKQCVTFLLPSMPLYMLSWANANALM